MNPQEEIKHVIRYNLYCCAHKWNNTQHHTFEDFSPSINKPKVLQNVCIREDKRKNISKKSSSVCSRHVETQLHIQSNFLFNIDGKRMQTFLPWDISCSKETRNKRARYQTSLAGRFVTGAIDFLRVVLGEFPN